MSTQTQDHGEIQGIGWLAGTVGALLLTSVGLELLAYQVFGPTDVETLLWALFLGFWTCVLGFAGFLILSVRWLVEWRDVASIARNNANNRGSLEQAGALQSPVVLSGRVRSQTDYQREPVEQKLTMTHIKGAAQ